MHTSSPEKQNARIRTQLFIDGKWVDGEGEEPFIVLNPFDNSDICRLRPASAAQVTEAVEAAYSAFRRPGWRKLAGRERGQLLLRLAQLLRRDLESFATLETLDTGIPIRETRLQIATAAAHLEYFAGLAGSIEGSYQDLGPRFDFTRREPFGVVAQIVPWNTPLKLMARGFAAAIACGNTMVIKPSVMAPMTNLRFSELVSEAGFPAGTVNVITGAGRSIGKLLTENSKVRKIIFTGGTEGGREILRQAAQCVAPAMLELGGKGPIIVCDNIDWDEAIDGVLTQAFARKAEVCFAGARLFVPSKLHDKFVSALAEKAARIPLGNPLDVHTQMGPLVSARSLSNILAHIEAAKKADVRVFCGGEKELRADLRKGNFIRPTILTHVKPGLAVARDELFGPVLCVFAYDGLNDAIRMSNDSDYGLAGYVWSNDIRESHRIAQDLEVGIVFLNAYEYQSEIPFGGYKASGIGREHGTEAIREYTQLKSVTVGMERFKSRFEI
jgi:betaine-aldehyde dehydrogenase